jgi:hypothetical protein
MVKAWQNLGDRLIGRVVPEVVAEAGVQDYQLYCGCFGEPGGVFVKKYKNCAAGYCGACYTVSGC